MNRRLGVLISGRGSNLKAIIDAIERRQLDASIAVVISNRADAPGLAHARHAGIETLVINHQPFKSREDYDRELVKALKDRGVALVCLAGFMRLLSPVMVAVPFPTASSIFTRRCCRNTRACTRNNRRSTTAPR